MKRFAPLVACFCLLSFSPARGQITPPPQPANGPGGSDYLHAEVTESGPFYAAGHDGDDAFRYFLFEPASPTPAEAPVALFMHGFGALTPDSYRAWIDHLVKKGYTVVWEQYQIGLALDGALDAAETTFVDALARLTGGGHVPPALDTGGDPLTAYVGHSMGGLLSTHLAARAGQPGALLPTPWAVVAFEPGLEGLLAPADLSTIDPDTKLLVLVGDEDVLVCDTTPKSIWAQTSHIPDTNRDFLLAVSDNTGTPPQKANHLFPLTVPVTGFPGGGEESAVDARDYYITWKLSVAALNCAFEGGDCTVALGDGAAEQIDMGQWSDGQDVNKLQWIANPASLVTTCNPGVDDSDPDYPTQFTEITEPGFGSAFNSKAWGMAWWKGNLYVSTARAHYCVQTAVLALEGAPGFRYPPKDPELACTPDYTNLPLEGEIWCYQPPRDRWTRVFQSSRNVPIPDLPGEFTARDTGFRNLLPFTDPDGTESLYAFGVTSESLFGFDAAGTQVPPRILRATAPEGGGCARIWNPVPQEPGTLLGDLGRGRANFRAAAVYDDRLFVVAADLRGGGDLLEASNPAGGNDEFQQVSPEDFKIYEMAVFNDQLFVGTDSLSIGAGAPEGFVVARTDASGVPPYNFTTVVDKGAWREGLPSNAVVSMHVFDPCLGLVGEPQCGEKLYVGTDKPAELIRIDPFDTVELIVGKARTDSPFGPLEPLSGYNTGFDDTLNEHIWRMQGHTANQGHRLFVGTNDLRPFLKAYRIFDPFLDYTVMGFDLTASPDGVDYSILTRTGYGGPIHTQGAATQGVGDYSPNQLDVGIRVFASTPWGLFFGTSNPFDGLRIFKDNQLGGDIDRNGKVDSNDIFLIVIAVGVPTTGPADRRDLNGNGEIDTTDILLAVGECTNPDCVP